MIKHGDKSSFEEEGLVLVCSSRGMESLLGEGVAGRGEAASLPQQTKGKESTRAWLDFSVHVVQGVVLCPTKMSLGIPVNEIKTPPQARSEALLSK